MYSTTGMFIAASEGNVECQFHASYTMYDVCLGDSDGMTRLSLMKKDL